MISCSVTKPHPLSYRLSTNFGCGRSGWTLLSIAVDRRSTALRGGRIGSTLRAAHIVCAASIGYVVHNIEPYLIGES